MTIPLTIDDLLTPFMLEGAQVRGRVVRLGHVAQTILARYDYPAPVARLLGELLVVAAMLSSNLKHEGIFTIQIRGEGPVPLVVVDAVYGGQIRGFADVPEASRAALAALPHYSPRAVVGEGAYLAITFDPGEQGQRYQGIVALEGDSVGEALTAYFTHSEQLDIWVKLTLSDGAPWVAGGVIIERMPDSSAASESHEEAWRYAKAVASTITDAELRDPLLDAPALLYRLFHEQGVWVYDAHPLSVGCRCSRARISDLLMSMSLADRADMVVDGVASVHCQFCNQSEIFTPAQLGLSVS
ncbi:MAG: Hsp33 family molecular chaperone HslO [Pseudomonadota bacterium]